MYICIYVYMYIYICIYVYMYICIYVYMYICIYVYMYICIYVYMYICIYVYMYMYMCDNERDQPHPTPPHPPPQHTQRSAHVRVRVTTNVISPTPPHPTPPPQHTQRSAHVRVRVTTNVISPTPPHPTHPRQEAEKTWYLREKTVKKQKLAAVLQEWNCAFTGRPSHQQRTGPGPPKQTSVQVLPLTHAPCMKIKALPCLSPLKTNACVRCNRMFTPGILDGKVFYQGMLKQRKPNCERCTCLYIRVLKVGPELHTGPWPFCFKHSLRSPTTIPMLRHSVVVRWCFGKFSPA